MGVHNGPPIERAEYEPCPTCGKKTLLVQRQAGSVLKTCRRCGRSELRTASPLLHWPAWYLAYTSWPIRTPVRKVGPSGSLRALFGVGDDYRCDRGHAWASTVPSTRWCAHCVQDVAYSMEMLGAALGGRKWYGRYPHMPTDRPSCTCHTKGLWPA